MKPQIALTAVALSLALSTTARAETPQMTQDLKCLALGFTLIQSTDPKVVEAAKVATFYYLGRVDGRDRTIDLADRFSKPDMQMSQDELQRMAQVCGGELSARSGELMDMSKRLEAAGR